MRYLLLTIPTPLLLLFVVGGSALLTIVVTHFVRTRFDERSHIANNEVAGFLLSVVGVIYGVLLAFMVLVVWQDYGDAQVTVEDEANVLVNIYRLGQELPAPYDEQVKALSIQYARRVMDNEWRTMASGHANEDVSDIIDQMWDEHRALHLAGLESGTHDEQLFQALEELGNFRRIRLLASRDELPTLMWLLLVGGAIVTLGFTLFLRAPNYTAHLLMAGMFAGLVAFVLILIIELDIPFTGEVSVKPIAFEQALDTFQRLGTR